MVVGARQPGKGLLGAGHDHVICDWINFSAAAHCTDVAGAPQREGSTAMLWHRRSAGGDAI